MERNSCMKKIAIVTRKMITGGVERALIAMLKQFDYSQVKIDIYLESLGGELLDEIPDEVNCHRIPTIKASAALRHPARAARKLYSRLKLCFGRYPYIEQCYLSSCMMLPVSIEYDVAIAYHAPNTVPVFYTIDGIQAARKILWLHGDLENNSGDTELAIRYHSKFDQVYAVSASAMESFLKIHPQMAERTALFYNFVDADGIMKKADIGPTFMDRFAGTRILSIGRLDAQKGFDMAITACRKLLDRGYRIRWYICGEGHERAALEKQIRENQLGDSFLLLGNQTNPYRYLKDCDLYVQPSRFEGYCTTTNEARMVGKPVITTQVSGAEEQFIHGVTGWIVPISAEAVADQIAYCLDHPDETEAVCARLKSTSLTQTNGVKQIYE